MTSRAVDRARESIDAAGVGRWASRAAGLALLCVLVVAPHARAGSGHKRPPTGPPEQGGCGSDPISGVWRAQAYDATRGRRVQWTLHIRRAGARLNGRITNFTFYGPSDLPPPPPCRGGLAYRVSTDAEGTFGPARRVDFNGVGTYRVDAALCGTLTGYHLDHFSGEVRGDRLDVRNDDGASARGDRYVFHRARCP